MSVAIPKLYFAIDAQDNMEEYLKSTSWLGGNCKVKNNLLLFHLHEFLFQNTESFQNKNFIM